MILGYARVSEIGESLEEQIDLLRKAGCERIFQEKKSSTQREQLELDRLLSHIRQGDLIIITNLINLCRSLKELFQFVEEVNDKGANIKSLRNVWLDTSTSQGKFIFTVFFEINRFERELQSKQTKAGLEKAMEKGRKGGRRRKPDDKIKHALKLYDDKNRTISEIIEESGISKATLFRYINKRKEEEKKWR